VRRRACIGGAGDGSAFPADDGADDDGSNGYYSDDADEGGDGAPTADRSGDATSGDERRRGEARAKPVERGKSEAQVRDFGSVVLQAYRLTSFCEARLLLELRVLAYGLSLTDRPIAVPPRLNCPTRCNHQNRPSWRSRDKLTSVT